MFKHWFIKPFSRFYALWKQHHEEKKRRKQYITFKEWLNHGDAPYMVTEVPKLGCSGSVSVEFEDKEALEKWLGDERATQEEYRRMVYGELNTWD